mmetsp:Transcript_32082/g.51875  ORF Transcript_32082/g.51875 Transcript_32082/m.51875 type:complete len:773 (-) Transcript_32082:1446-3764(-)
MRFDRLFGSIPLRDTIADALVKHIARLGIQMAQPFILRRWLFLLLFRLLFRLRQLGLLLLLLFLMCLWLTPSFLRLFFASTLLFRFLLLRQHLLLQWIGGRSLVGGAQVLTKIKLCCSRRRSLRWRFILAFLALERLVVDEFGLRRMRASQLLRGAIKVLLCVLRFVVIERHGEWRPRRALGRVLQKVALHGSNAIQNVLHIFERGRLLHTAARRVQNRLQRGQRAFFAFLRLIANEHFEIVFEFARRRKHVQTQVEQVPTAIHRLRPIVVGELLDELAVNLVAKLFLLVAANDNVEAQLLLRLVLVFAVAHINLNALEQFAPLLLVLLVQCRGQMRMNLVRRPRHHILTQFVAAKQFLRRPIMILLQNRTILNGKRLMQLVEHQILQLDIQTQLPLEIAHLDGLPHLLLHKLLRVLAQRIKHPAEVVDVVVGVVEFGGGKQTRLHVRRVQRHHRLLTLAIDHMDAIAHAQRQFALFSLVLLALNNGAHPLQLVQVLLGNGLLQQVFGLRIDTRLDELVQQLLGLLRQCILNIVSLARTHDTRHALKMQLRFGQRCHIRLNQRLERLIHFPLLHNDVAFELEHTMFERAIQQHGATLANVARIQMQVCADVATALFAIAARHVILFQDTSISIGKFGVTQSKWKSALSNLDRLKHTRIRQLLKTSARYELQRLFAIVGFNAPNIVWLCRVQCLHQLIQLSAKLRTQRHFAFGRRQSAAAAAFLVFGKERLYDWLLRRVQQQQQTFIQNVLVLGHKAIGGVHHLSRVMRQHEA